MRVFKKDIIYAAYARDIMNAKLRNEGILS